MIQIEPLYEQIYNLNLSDIDITIGQALPVEATNLTDIALAALRGEIDLSMGNIFNWILSGIFTEVSALFHLLRQMLIIAILSAFFKAMTTSFQNSGISKLGFYICYVLVVVLLFQTFSVAIYIMTSMVNNIVTLLMGSTPIIIGLVASGGYIASAGAFAPILLFAASFLTVFIDILIVPTLIFAATISLISYLSEKESLDKLSKIMQKGIAFGLKGIALIFMAVLGFQRIATPIVNTLAIRGTRTAVSAVPVVGQALSGAIDTALYYSAAARGAASSALLIAVVAISIVPILQVAAFVAVYKLSAALLAPICDERIIEAIDTMGGYAALVLGVCVLAAFLFIFIVLITLASFSF
ncbi:MAG: stage III sporulation protein AE [Defluviitaleaceae bacterium]|nr:stage III sporulation protein AE [Defluviitaleaceae bacterium]